MSRLPLHRTMAKEANNLLGDLPTMAYLLGYCVIEYEQAMRQKLVALVSITSRSSMETERHVHLYVFGIRL